MREMKSALVTGASGFIGRNLCIGLKTEGVRVRGLMQTSHTGSWDEAILADIATEVPAQAFVGIDTVFHLAGKVHAVDELQQDGDEYRRVNVCGTQRVFAAAKSAGVSRFVFFSSVKAMGEGSWDCQNENSNEAPVTAYGRSKLAAEKLVLAGAREARVDAVVLRLPLVYGPNSPGNLTRMLSAIAAGRFPPLPEIGNRRSMIHVDDVVKAALLVAVTPKAASQCYIMTDGLGYSTTKIYQLMRASLGCREVGWTVPLIALRISARFGDLIGRTSGRRFGIDSKALSKLTDSAYYDSTKIRRELDFTNDYTLEQAMDEMVSTYRGLQGVQSDSERAD